MAAKAFSMIADGLGVEIAGQDVRLHFHHGDLDAGLGEVLRRVHADQAAAQHHARCFESAAAPARRPMASSRVRST